MKNQDTLSTGKLDDFTQLGAYKKKSNTRPADNTAHKETKDDKHDKFSEFSHKDDDEQHRKPMFKGDGYEGSATSDDWLDKDYVKSRLKSASVDVDMEAMKKFLESTLDDKEFVEQAIDVFKVTVEDAVSRLEEALAQTAIDLVTENVLEIQEAYEEQLQVEVDNLNESISDYVDLAVMEWMTDNKLAIQESTEASIASAFMEDLGALLTAYNVTVPEDKVDLYESAVDAGNKLIDDYDKLVEAYNDVVAENLNLKREVVTESWIADNDLTDTQAERIRVLAENLQFTDDNIGTYVEKLDMLAESVGSRYTNSRNTYVDHLMEDVYTDGLDESADQHIDDEVLGIVNSTLFNR